MAPEIRGSDAWYTVYEAAQILGVTRQALYQAISGGQLRAKKETGSQGRRIHAKDVLAYGITTGRDPHELVSRVQDDTGADTWDVLMWVLDGLGLSLLITSLLRKTGE